MSRHARMRARLFARFRFGRPVSTCYATLMLSCLPLLQDIRSRGLDNADDSAAWRKKLQTLCDKKGIDPRKLAVPDRIQASPWFSTLGKREQMGVAYNVAAHPSVTSLDVYQSADRMFKGYSRILTPIVPSSKIFLTSGECRLVTGVERLVLQGFWEDIVLDILNREHGEGFSDTALRDLAGNAWTGTVFVAVLIGLLVRVPLPRRMEEQGPPADVEELDDLL